MTRTTDPVPAGGRGSPDASRSHANRPDLKVTGVPTRVLVFGMMRADGTVDAAELLHVAEA